MKNSPHKIQFVFQRERHVQCGNFSSLTEMFSLERIAPAGLRRYCGTVQVRFSGYADEKRLPFVIPEIRTFLRKLNKEWPYAPFFCDLDNSFLALEAVAHLDHISVLEKAGSQEFGFWVNTRELQRHVRQSHNIIQMLGQRASLPAGDVEKRIKQFDDYIALRLGPFQEA
jgi:hypothetical protein